MEIEDTLPKEISSLYDLMDAITWYAKKAVNNNSQKAIEERIFKFFFAEYKHEIETQSKSFNFKGIDIKSFLPGVEMKEIKDFDHFQTLITAN